MDAAEIRARFDREVRADPPAQLGRVTAWTDGVLRHTGAYNFVDWWDFGEDRAFEIAAREAAFYGALGGGLKWKVYDHDRPANLGAALAAAGFVAAQRETFMAFDLEAPTAWGAAPEGVEVRRIADRAGVADFMEVHDAAFGEPGSWTVDFLASRLADPTLAIYVAYVDGAPATGGRLELVPGTSFAGLYGGGTVPAFRGRGVYRALVAARAAEARRRGFRTLIVDARETSRPILQRLGFQPIVPLTPWRL
jgi:hypothetical protein